MSELEVKPWLSIWVKPKQTIRAVINYNVKYRFFALSFLYGLPTVLQLAQNLSLSSVFSLPAILLFSAILSPIFGVIGLLLCTLFLTWTGKLLGGRATFLEMRCAVSWSNATNLACVIIWLVLIGQFREMLFYEGFVKMPMTLGESVSVSIYFLLQFVIAVWSFILLLCGVSEAHRFSVWKALLNVVIAFVCALGISWVFLFVLEGIMGVRA